MPAATGKTRASSIVSDTPSAELTRITATVSADAVEIVIADACAAFGVGCAERTVAGAVALDFWLPAEHAEAACAILRGLRPGITVETATETNGWREAMRAFHQPITIGEILRVRPPWQPAVPGPIDVVIDPGMAFGTGQHATTHTCLEFLVALPAGSVVDVGCGSGVLAIAARKLGHDPVWAFDHDPLCVEATTANAHANDVVVPVAAATVGVEPLPVADTILANLTANVLAELAQAVVAAPPRRAVLSGLRPGEVEVTLARWAVAGLSLVERRDADGWSTLLVAR